MHRKQSVQLRKGVNYHIEPSVSQSYQSSSAWDSSQNTYGNELAAKPSRLNLRQQAIANYSKE